MTKLAPSRGGRCHEMVKSSETGPSLEKPHHQVRAQHLVHLIDHDHPFGGHVHPHQPAVGDDLLFLFRRSLVLQRMRLGFLKYIQPTAESEAPAAFRRDSWRKRAGSPRLVILGLNPGHHGLRE